MRRATILVLGLAAACERNASYDLAGDIADKHKGAEGKMGKKEVARMPAAAAAPEAPAPGKMPGRSGRADAHSRTGYDEGTLGSASRDVPMELESADEAVGGEAAPTRGWFPETFLFEPLVVTDAAGTASVSARVPDRLTTWRVLALAHSRDGAQAGALSSFLGTLPTYVEPVTPSFALAGDELRLPIQAVNTTDREVATTLTLDALGATVDRRSVPVRLPPNASWIETVTVRVPRPGTATLRAALAGSDAVVRTFPVRPAGRPAEQRRSGTLAAPRILEIAGPTDLDPASAQVRLAVFPGALAVLRSELSAVQGRGGLYEDAYALLLAGSAPRLLDSLGDRADPEAVRNLALIAGQRALRHARAPDAVAAATLAEAAAANPDHAVVARLAARLFDQVVRAQRPDGSFEGGSGWTLQRLLVTTASCVRAVRAAATADEARRRAMAVALRASGAFERNLDRIHDAYTAAAVVASGAAPPAVVERLRGVVRDAVKARPDGSRSVVPETGVVRPDGGAPSEIEATALAALALDGDEKAPWRPDLGAALLAGYSPAYGWGDGQTNLVSLRAVLSLFRDRVPPDVKITLAFDGEPVAAAVLDATRVKDVVTLEAAAPKAAGRHVWTVRADPAVAGLGFALVLHTWVPWKAEPAEGLELRVEAAGPFEVGKPAAVHLAATAPAGIPLRVRHGLPAGVQVDTPSLEALASAGAVTSFRVAEGQVTLEVQALAPGAAFRAQYRVIPTLAGRLSAPASSVSVSAANGASANVPPAVWTIR